MRGAKDWVEAKAPSLADIELIAADAWDRVPAEFRQLCRDIVFRVEDFADESVLDDLGIEDAFELMGLYKGVSLDRKSSLDQAVEPDMVFLYRRPLLDYWSEGEETLGDLVTHVLIHEVGHHFGLSDADMEQIEADTREI